MHALTIQFADGGREQVVLRRSDPGGIRRFAPYQQLSYAPPAWTRWPKVWGRPVEVFREPAPEFPAVFIHRDFSSRQRPVVARTGDRRGGLTGGQHRAGMG